MLYLANINLNQNELQNAVIQPLAAPPATPRLGQIYTDSTNSKIKWYTGTEWKTVGVIVESSSANGSIIVDGVEMTVYTLPKATAEVLGGIKVGNGLVATDEGVLSVDVVNNLTSEDTNKALSAAMGKSLKQAIDNITTDIGEMGGGDMMKATYDTNNNGVVDDAEKLGGQLPSYYAKSADVPTKVSQLSNDENFIKNTVDNLTNYYKKSETYTKTEVTTLLGQLSTIQISIPEDGKLPTTGSSNIIYLIPKTTADGDDNYYDEYLWTGTKFEKIGDTTIDLSGYTKDADLANIAKSGSWSDLKNRPAIGLVKKMSVSITDQTKNLTVSSGNIMDIVLSNTQGELVMADITYTSTSAATVSLSEVPDDAITATVWYVETIEGTT